MDMVDLLLVEATGDPGEDRDMSFLPNMPVSVLLLFLFRLNKGLAMPLLSNDAVWKKGRKREGGRKKGRKRKDGGRKGEKIAMKFPGLLRISDYVLFSRLNISQHRSERSL